MPDDNFSSSQDNNQQVDPLLSFDPLADQGGGNNSNTGTTPISPITSIPKPQSDFGGGEGVDYSLPENKELARQKANEFMDQGQFAEAAKILKASGMHQTVTPKPEAPVPSSTPPNEIPTPPISPEIPVPTPATPQPEITVPPTPNPEPDIAASPAPIPPKAFETPASQTPESEATFPIPPTNLQETPPLPVQEEPQITAPPAPIVNLPSQTSGDDPDFFLKKAYDLRKNLLEYDRSKVAEEEKLQAAEDLIFQGKKEEAIKIYKTIAAEAEEKKEAEVAIEAYERLATLLR